MTWSQRKEWLSCESGKDDAVSRSPLSPPYTGWQAGRCAAICNPLGSSNGCHKWISPRCWTPGSAVNVVSTAWLVLVALHGCANAKSDQKMQMMYPTWRHLCQSTTTAHCCHSSFGATICRLHKQWDDYGAAPTPKCGECSDFLQSFYETHYGLCDPRPNCKDCC